MVPGALPTSRSSKGFRRFPAASLSRGDSFPCSVANEILRIAEGDETFVGIPDLVRDLLLDLKSPRGVEPNTLKVADHDVDDALERDYFVWIILEAKPGRGHDRVFLRPELSKRRVRAPLHVGLLHQDEPLRIEPSLEEELPCEQNVLAGVRRPVLDQHRLFGNSYPSRNPREFLRLGLVPNPPVRLPRPPERT